MSCGTSGGTGDREVPDGYTIAEKKRSEILTWVPGIFR